MKRLVLVDFDDTLVETAPAFHSAREALFSLLEREGFDSEDAQDLHFNQVDPEFLAEHGMGPFRMAPSFRETYLRLCRKHGVSPSTELADECAALGRDFLGKPRVMDGSLEALRTLTGAFPTAVFSQAAQLDYQMGRVDDAGVTEVVGRDRVLITDRKTPEAFRKALRHFGVQDPRMATMVGNSLRSDINPALLVGAEAILVEPYKMWEYDNVPPVSQDFVRFTTFPEAVDFLLSRAPEPSAGAGD
jgi:putative hydrolase of the HAD superfamily